MGIPLSQALKIGAYVVRQHVSGNKHYPLVLMMEPLFRCNLACAGCGKIDYPDEILNQRISVADALQAVDSTEADAVMLDVMLHGEAAFAVAQSVSFFAFPREKIVTQSFAQAFLDNRPTPDQ